MHKLWKMPTNKQFKELRATMHKLLWKMLCMLIPGRFYIPISNRKCITQIVRLTRANVSSCQKSVAKKFEMLIVKHVVPNVVAALL